MKRISKKAYEGFNQRVIAAFRSIDPYFLDGIGIVMGMIDLFLGGKDVMFKVRSKEVKLVYALLLPEVEKAVERSERARANAARRREKKLAEKEAALKKENEKNKNNETVISHEKKEAVEFIGADIRVGADIRASRDVKMVEDMKIPIYMSGKLKGDIPN
ncbi:MAG: hypothetical protein J6A20_03245 [Muribaculaceae bacterium]|nr:hypothetical protein [Muribaculaceae bacterium]